MQQPVGAPMMMQPAPMSLSARAEPADKQNDIYLELGGTSLLYSLNYERFLNPDLAIRVGFSFISVSAVASNGMTTDSATASWATVPLMAEYTGIRSGFEFARGRRRPEHDVHVGPRLDVRLRRRASRA